jgi:cytosolic carboxypeptidase protein 6
VLAATSLVAFAAMALAQAASAPLCAGAGLQVLANFERARASACSIGDDRTVTIEIAPETQPINDSAWFAFKIRAAAPAPVRLILNYSGGTHRYRPKVSHDGETWRVIPNALVAVSQNQRQATFTIEAGVGEISVAAQPLETSAMAMARWAQTIAAKRLIQTTVGSSVRGEPIFALATLAQSTSHTLVLIARQHPPETAGAVAFDAFFARLLEDDALAVAFRSRVAILAFPVLNPDGIASGHWRTNAAGSDLNRDWGPFRQPETAAAARAIEYAVRARPLIGLIDFHATFRDVIYAQPADAAMFPALLGESWFARWRAFPGGTMPPISRAHDPAQANAKTWSRLRFGVSGVTYEVADEADLESTRATARASAESFMGAFLALTPAQLTPRSTLQTR